MIQAFFVTLWKKTSKDSFHRALEETVPDTASYIRG
jgi:hypothetical protein